MGLVPPDLSMNLHIRPFRVHYYGDPLLAGCIIEQQRGQKSTRLCAKALGYSLCRWLVLPKYTEPRSNTVVAQESSLVKLRCFPLLVKFHPVNNGSP